MNRHAVRDVCARYGIKLAEDPGVAVYPVKQVAPDPDLERQRQRSGIDSAFMAHEIFDRATPDQMPDPGVINRVEG